jgi:hypothetical protein
VKLDEILKPGHPKYELVTNRPDMFKVQQKIGGRTIRLVCEYNEDEDIWEVAFFDTTEGRATSKPTDEHKALDVMAFVAAGLQEFIDLHHPTKFLWSVEDGEYGDKRGRVYAAMFKRSFPQYTAEPTHLGSDKKTVFHTYTLKEVVNKMYDTLMSEQEWREICEDAELLENLVSKFAKVKFDLVRFAANYTIAVIPPITKEQLDMPSYFAYRDAKKPNTHFSIERVVTTDDGEQESIQTWYETQHEAEQEFVKYVRAVLASRKDKT